MHLKKRRVLVAFKEKTEYWSESFKSLDFSSSEISSKEFDAVYLKNVILVKRLLIDAISLIVSFLIVT